MTSYIRPRQPFGVLDGPRLHMLASVKNQQNAITNASQDNPLSPSKDFPQSPGTKRRYSPYSDEEDSENVDPSIFNSKRSRSSNGTPLEPFKFSRTDTFPQLSFATPANTPDNSTMKRKQNSFSVPAPTNKTAIAHSRGSPKHNRVGLLSKHRRLTSSPFHRVDPPLFSAGTGLPFSIDAALSGTISSYKPAHVSPSVDVVVAEPKPMPKGWFFDIHEDSADEEASNLMEHSAATLDISSDDDCMTRRRRAETELGKENIPPPDWVNHSRSRPERSIENSVTVPIHKGMPKKAKAIAKAFSTDAMQEDRAALGALLVEDFYPDGMNEHAIQTVDSTQSQETCDSVVALESPAKQAQTTAEQQPAVIICPDSAS